MPWGHVHERDRHATRPEGRGPDETRTARFGRRELPAVVKRDVIGPNASDRCTQLLTDSGVVFLRMRWVQKTCGENAASIYEKNPKPFPNVESVQFLSIWRPWMGHEQLVFGRPRRSKEHGRPRSLGCMRSLRCWIGGMSEDPIVQL